MDPSIAVSPLDLLDPADAAFVARVVSSARGYLGARISFFAEVAGDEKIIRQVEGQPGQTRLPVGARFPLEDSYCQRMLQGIIPEVIYDVHADERSRDIPLTRVLEIDSYMGVPVTMPGGRVLGTLCCINFEPAPERRTRDLALMHFLADLVAHQLDESVRARDLRRQRHDAIHGLLQAGGPTMVFQPIVLLETGAVVGVEALARFGAPVQATPDVWFREAWASGLGRELEMAAIRAALPALARLPADAFLSVNASPATIAHPAFADAIAGIAGHRLVVEITEHAVVEDYAELVAAIGRLRGMGVRIAIDDVGAGYASLRHVLEVAPDIAKLDMSLTRLIDADAVRQAMAVGMMAFAGRTGVDVVAEGVETAAEAAALREAGVRYAQGYLFARPGALPPPPS